MMRFQRLRLPRPLEVSDAPQQARLEQALLPPGGLLVAEERVEGETRILAYLTLIHERDQALDAHHPAGYHARPARRRHRQRNACGRRPAGRARKRRR